MEVLWGRRQSKLGSDTMWPTNKSAVGRIVVWMQGIVFRANVIRNAKDTTIYRMAIDAIQGKVPVRRIPNNYRYGAELGDSKDDHRDVFAKENLHS